MECMHAGVEAEPRVVIYSGHQMLRVQFGPFTHMLRSSEDSYRF